MDITYPHSINHFEVEDFGFVLTAKKEDYSKRPSIYALVFNDKGEIASIKYREETGRMYPLPGGGVDEGESLIQALVREVLEEVGCNIKNIKQVGSFGSYDNRSMRCFQSVICFADLDGEPQEPKPAEDYEQGAELVWITPAKLISKLEALAGPVDNTKDGRSRFTLEILKNTLLTPTVYE